LDKPPGTPDNGSTRSDDVATPAQPGSATGAPRSAPSADSDEARSKEDRARQQEDLERGVDAQDLERATRGDSVAAPADGKDPLGGKFTLADATATLPGTGPLIATIKTSQGELSCRLFDDKAPTTVANFVGLARGVRPWKKDGQWVKQPIYDGTTFHRVIKGFMIQGGDPKGNGTGEPGYVIPDEIWPGAKHDHAGQLCMANRGPNTNGAQFFITDASVPQLDSNYTIFGECTPVSVVHAIARVPTIPQDRPATPVTIDKVEIAREASARASVPVAPSGSAATKPKPGSGDPLSPAH
jgi:peptidyl-prolyl cis-trans isomerase A (cyclophilin A)